MQVIDQDANCLDEFSHCCHFATFLVIVQQRVGDHVMNFGESPVRLVADLLLLICDHLPIHLHCLNIVFVEMVKISKARAASRNELQQFRKVKYLSFSSILQPLLFSFKDLNGAHEIGSAGFEVIVPFCFFLSYLIVPLLLLFIINNLGEVPLLFPVILLCMRGITLVTAVFREFILCNDWTQAGRVIHLREFFGIEQVDVLLHFLEDELGVFEVQFGHVEMKFSESGLGLLHQVVEFLFGLVSAHGLHQVQV